MSRFHFTCAAGAITITAALGACAGKTDRRLELLTAGIGKDSVLKVMGVQQPEKTAAYLVSGIYIETMYFPVAGATDSASIMDRKMSPVILFDGKLAAWGWNQWDSIAAAKKIAVAPK